MLHMVENGRDTEEDKGDITEMLTNMSRMDVITEGSRIKRREDKSKADLKSLENRPV